MSKAPAKAAPKKAAPARPSKPVKKTTTGPVKARSAASLKAAATARRTASRHAKATLKADRANRARRTLSPGGNVKLGRSEPYARHEKPRLIIDHYLHPAHYVSGPVDRASKVSAWPMYDNDQIGDCTCACIGHEVQAFTAYASSMVELPLSAILTAYEAVSGYDPATGQNDDGAAVQDVLEHWRTEGVGGHKILAYAELSGIHSKGAVATALDLFGSVYLGVAMPQSAMDQFQAGEPWSVVRGSEIVGGHAIPVQATNAGGVEVVTWGQLQPVDWAWYSAYTEEAWVVITEDWLNAKGGSPTGLDLAQLEKDFEELTGSRLRP